MNHKTSYTLFLAGTVVSIVLFLAAILLRRWLAIPGFVVLAATYVQIGLFLRCPHCGVGLRVKGGRPKFCRDCGEKIDW